MILTRVSRKYVEVPVTATLASGGPASLDTVEVALLPPRTRPSGTTVWSGTAYANGVATVLLAGPDADTSGDPLVVPAAGAELWIRVTDSPEVEAVKVTRISVD